MNVIIEKRDEGLMSLPEGAPSVLIAQGLSLLKLTRMTQNLRKDLVS